jgi:stearoyl-CoA desaturase (delta-9 desaturase)
VTEAVLDPHVPLEQEDASEPAAAVATVRERTTRTSQVVTLIAVVVPPLGLLSAAGILWGVAVSWLSLAVFLVFYVACGLGTTVGFHRLFTHRSFETTKTLRATFAVLGSMTMQGPVTQWVTDHRKHHALSDKEGDPHSPHAGQPDSVWGAVKGFAHAHVGWLFHLKGMERGVQYGKDMYEDRMIRTIDRLYLLWIVLTFGIPFLIGYLAGGLSWQLGLEVLVWGGLVRVFAYQHATFAVNSICHMFGGRAYRSRDESRNNWLVASLTFGEGWHNNHHAFPSSARHGLDRFQVDIAWLTIRTLEKLKLAWNVRIPAESQRQVRRLADDAA